MIDNKEMAKIWKEYGDVCLSLRQLLEASRLWLKETENTSIENFHEMYHFWLSDREVIETLDDDHWLRDDSFREKYLYDLDKDTEDYKIEILDKNKDLDDTEPINPIQLQDKLIDIQIDNKLDTNNFIKTLKEYCLI